MTLKLIMECDRCGVQNNVDGTKEINLDELGYFHLCAACKEALRDFMRNGRDTQVVVKSPLESVKCVFINEYEDMDDWRVWPTEQAASKAAGPQGKPAVPYIRLRS